MSEHVEGLGAMVHAVAGDLKNDFAPEYADAGRPVWRPPGRPPELPAPVPIAAPEEETPWTVGGDDLQSEIGILY